MLLAVIERAGQVGNAPGSLLHRGCLYNLIPNRITVRIGHGPGVDAQHPPCLAPIPDREGKERESDTYGRLR